MLQLTGLKKDYDTKHVLTDIDFDVSPGEIVALLGKNGAGKTTIMNCIAGIISPTDGDILFQGQSLLPQSHLRSRFGILIQAVFFDYLNVEDNLRILLRSAGRRDAADIRRRIDTILDMVGLAEQKKKRVRSFSFGMRQRLGLAQALMNDFDFLMLDEPLVGLDPPGKELFKNALLDAAHKDGKAVLFSSHDLPDVADICDRIVMIKNGRVMFDGPYEQDRRIEIETVGESHTLTDPTQLNDLIAAGVFASQPIRDIRIHENSLMQMFSE